MATTLKPAQPRASHSAFLACGLSLFMPGLGQLYNRKYFVALFLGSLGVGLWCAGFGWIVHIIAGFYAWMSAKRIQEWGLHGRSIRRAARYAIDAQSRVHLVLPEGETSAEIQSALDAAERAEGGMRWVSKVAESHIGASIDGLIGMIGSAMDLVFFFVDPIAYAVNRRAWMRSHKKLSRLGCVPLGEE